MEFPNPTTFIHRADKVCSYPFMEVVKHIGMFGTFQMCQYAGLEGAKSFKF